VNDARPDAPPGELCCFEHHQNWVQSVAFSPDGRHLLSGSGEPPGADQAVRDYTVRLWDLEAGRELRCLAGHADQVTCVAFFPDGRRCLSAGHDHVLRVWDLETGRELRRLAGHTDRVKSVAIAADGRLALSGGCDSMLRLWDLEHGREVHRFRKHKHWVMSVALSPDGRLAVSGGYDHTVRLWEVASGRELRTGGLGRLTALVTRREHHRFEGHRSTVDSVAFSPNGRQVLSAGMDKVMRLWDVATGTEVRKFAGHAAGVTSATFSPDGGRIVSSSLDETVRVWSADTGEELACFRGHAGEVMSVAVSPGGRTAASGGVDRTVRVWRLPPNPTGPAGRTLSGSAAPGERDLRERPGPGPQLRLFLGRPHPSAGFSGPGGWPRPEAPGARTGCRGPASGSGSGARS
jgi:WD40 repeat protein